MPSFFCACAKDNHKLHRKDYDLSITVQLKKMKRSKIFTLKNWPKQAQLLSERFKIIIICPSNLLEDEK